MCDDSERLSLDEFLLVSLGSLLGSWDKESTQTVRLARVVAQVGSQLCSTPQPSRQTLWLRFLGQAADRLVHSSDEDRPIYQRLVSLGKRRASHLLKDIPEIFGLKHMPSLLDNMDHTEDKIELMRRVGLRLAKARQIDPKYMRVVYRFRDIAHDHPGWEINEFLEWERSNTSWGSHYVYTTVVAHQEDSLKRDSTGQPVSRERHVRWIYYSDAEQWRLGENYFAGLKESLRTPRGMAPDDLRLEFGTFLERNVAGLWGYGIEHIPECDNSEDEFRPSDFIFVAGMYGECGVYVSPAFSSLIGSLQSSLREPTLDDVEWALSNRVARLEWLVDAFRHANRTVLFNTKIMAAFAAVVETYYDLANSTIALKAIYRPLSDFKWAKKCQFGGIGNEDQENIVDSDITLCSLSRELKFALLVYMETGQADVDPQTFDRVVAMCSGDSIFVSAPILLDPFESTANSSTRMRCLRGNIGKTGIALLTTPEDPLMKSSHEANWKVIGHEPFNGELLDSFKGTSLQLGFTNFKLPIDTGNLGAYDMDLIFMEAIIRVNDHNGNWVGDLNILRAMEKWTRVNFPIDCDHKDDDRAVRNIPSATAIDNWDEFLDEPDGAMVFRARENWIARLSAAGFGGQQGKRLVVIVPHCADVCWSCLYKFVDQKDWPKLLLIC